MTTIPQDRRKDRHRDRRNPQLRKPFCGVDGEGGNFPTGHEYMLLRAGEFVLETGKPLTSIECLGFLADLPKDRIYVAYFFDYDVTMMLRDLSPERLKRLLDKDCRRIPKRPCSSFPIDVGDFQIDYTPRKEFKVRRQKGQWTIIHDTGSFFQQSFVAALRAWFGTDETLVPIIDRIAIGKDQRNEFGAVTEEERNYNKLEIAMLERLMTQFRDLCDSLDIRPHKWQGPGNLVSAVFKRESLPPNKDIPLFSEQRDVALMANAAYYGGRFEVSCIGDIPGPIYQYDINSAYANTYKDLPCLVHGTWEPITELPRDGIYLAEITFKHPPKLKTWGTLPVRTKQGTLIFPREGRGIYWSTELAVARKHGVQLTVHRGYRYVNHCDCEAFDFVYRMYNKRKALGKDSRGKVLKIVLASTYGKLAQSVGCAPYSNPVWAGLIVSTVRAQLIDAALSVSNGSDVLMLATDGLFTRKPIPRLSVGTELGQWDLTEHGSIFIVQSGVYFLPDKTPKTRGIPQSRVIAHEHDFRRIWNEYLDTGELKHVDIPLRNFTGIRLAMARNKPFTAGQWTDVTKSIGFDWKTKRTNARRKGTYLTTSPLKGSSELESQAYNRVIGGLRAAERLTFEDQPDWGDVL